MIMELLNEAKSLLKRPGYALAVAAVAAAPATQARADNAADKTQITVSHLKLANGTTVDCKGNAADGMIEDKSALGSVTISSEDGKMHDFDLKSGALEFVGTASGMFSHTSSEFTYLDRSGAKDKRADNESAKQVRSAADQVYAICSGFWSVNALPPGATIASPLSFEPSATYREEKKQFEKEMTPRNMDLGSLIPRL